MDPLQKIADTQSAKQVFSLLEEFKNFAFKGNVIDLAVGVIIGTAFGNIVSSLVKQVLMPLLSVLVPANEGYVNWTWIINGKQIHYGQFLGEVVNFLIVTFALYLFIVKFLGWMMRSKKEEAATLTKDQELLTEIRDLLKRPAEAEGKRGAG